MDESNTMIGTLYYVAPEIVLGKSYGRSADV
jgi:serine/threonine protein kinase